MLTQLLLLECANSPAASRGQFAVLQILPNNVIPIVRGLPGFQLVPQFKLLELVTELI